MTDLLDTDDDLGASTVNRYSPERVHRLEQQLAALREAALAEVARQRHQYAILRQELPPTTAALAALLQGEKG